MCNASRLVRGLTLLAMVIFLGGCLEIDEHYHISRDGKADARIIFKIDPQYESLLLPELDKKLRASLPPEMKVDSSQRIDGKAAVVVEGQQLDLATLSSSDQPMRLTIAQAGFLKKQFLFTVTAGKTPELPIPHRLTVSLPGSIERSNGRKVDSNSVEFDLTKARRGTSFQAASTAFAFGVGSNTSGIGGPVTTADAGGANAARSWATPTLLGAVALCVVLAVGAVAWKRRTVSIVGQDGIAESAAPSTTSSAPHVTRSCANFCDACGAPQASTLKFCSKCGATLT